MENQERAFLALQALQRLPDQSLHENITDLLTNIRHLCNQEKIDFDYLVTVSDIHFNSERG